MCAHAHAHLPTITCTHTLTESRGFPLLPETTHEMSSRACPEVCAPEAEEEEASVRGVTGHLLLFCLLFAPEERKLEKTSSGLYPEGKAVCPHITALGPEDTRLEQKGEELCRDGFLTGRCYGKLSS